MSLERLAGAWRLLSFEFTDAEGGKFHPLGENPSGSVVIAAGGHFSLTFMALGRADFAADDLFAATPEERAAAAGGYVAFGGPCRVKGDAIEIEVEYSLFPNWVGKTQIRLFELDGDRLTLRTAGPRLFAGVERSGQARLVRATA